MNKELREIREQLEEIATQEANKLYRVARKLQSHGGSDKTVAKIREEAYLLHFCAYPERLIDPFTKWEYAFKF